MINNCKQCPHFLASANIPAIGQCNYFGGAVKGCDKACLYSHVAPAAAK